MKRTQPDTVQKGQKHRRADQELVADDVCQQAAVQNFVGNTAQARAEQQRGQQQSLQAQQVHHLPSPARTAKRHTIDASGYSLNLLINKEQLFTAIPGKLYRGSVIGSDSVGAHV